MSELNHSGVKGMRWGVRRNSNRPGGADGKEESTKVIDNRSGVKKRLDSMKRERDWHKVLKEMDKLTTKDINSVKKRLDLENSLKTLSKSPVAKKKDKDDYLRREHMSDAELSRKVTRLNAKKNLYKSVKDASKEQREFGTKVVQVASSIGVKYALNRGTITPKDLFNEAWDIAKTPKESYDKAKGEALNKVPNPIAKDILKTALSQIEKKANPPKS
jgi:hypothetical protein